MEVALRWAPCSSLGISCTGVLSLLSVRRANQLGHIRPGALKVASAAGFDRVSISSEKRRVFQLNGSFLSKKSRVRYQSEEAPAVPDAEAEQDEEIGGWLKKVEKLGEALSSAFPLWVALACVLALIWPNATGWINQRVQVFGLTITMLGMGMTLTLKDFEGAFLMPKELLAGVLLQYTVMPLSGYFVSRILQLPPHYAAGLILVACCPGGTASNIVTYLARGNVALSVLMTAASTFLAVVMTPVLTSKLAGQYISVDAASLFVSTFQVVLLPVLGGAFLNVFFKDIVKKLALLAPSVAVFMVAILCAGAVGRNAAAVLSSGGQVFLAVGALHSLGFGGGYLLSKNSVLGVVLAGQHFSNPLTAVPCAVSSVCHSVFGSTLAGLWRINSTSAEDDQRSVLSPS